AHEPGAAAGGCDRDQRDDDPVLAQALAGLGLQELANGSAHDAPLMTTNRRSGTAAAASVDDPTSGRSSGAGSVRADNPAVRAKKLEQICEELARTVGAAPDSCVVAWNDSSAPTIVFATGNTEAVL